MPRYDFEFISNYDGVSDYRLFIDGKPDTRISVRLANSKMTYSDGSKVLKPEVDAFNVFQRLRHRAAILKHGENAIGACAEYWS